MNGVEGISFKKDNTLVLKTDESRLEIDLPQNGKIIKRLNVIENYLQVLYSDPDDLEIFKLNRTALPRQ